MLTKQSEMQSQVILISSLNKGGSEQLQDNKISTEKIAIALGVSSKTIKRHIKEMYNVSYIGRGFSGHWENKDDE